MATSGHFAVSGVGGWAGWFHELAGRLVARISWLIDLLYGHDDDHDDDDDQAVRTVAWWLHELAGCLVE